MTLTRLAPLAAAALLAMAARAAASPNALTVVAVLQDDAAFAGAHDIEVRDGLAYIAGKGGSLAIVDVRQPASPNLLWSARDSQAYEDAQTVLPLGDNRLLVGARDLLLFDIRQPTQPTLLATIKDRPRIDRINGFARSGNTVYGANKNGFIVVADVSAPDRIRLLGVRPSRERDNLATPHDLALAGDLLVVVDGRSFGRESKPGQVGVYRVVDPATRAPLAPDQWSSPSIVSDLRFAGANRVKTNGTLAFVCSSLAPESPRHTGLQNNVSIVDLSDPARLRVRGSIAFPDGRGPNGLEFSGQVVFAAGGQTVQAIDVSNPDQPRELARVTAPSAFPGEADDGHDLAYHDGYLFVTAQTSHALVVLRVEGRRLLDAADAGK
ncbi:MAG: hypothetical protein EXS37_04325 [Opitutus sp.]|nr:hypothetical protein [Opitutus sp.]